MRNDYTKAKGKREKGGEADVTDRARARLKIPEGD
jgi:hypothetical protein